MSPATLQMASGQPARPGRRADRVAGEPNRVRTGAEASAMHNERLVERIARSGLPADMELKNSVVEFSGAPNGVAFLASCANSTTHALRLQPSDGGQPDPLRSKNHRDHVTAGNPSPPAPRFLCRRRTRHRHRRAGAGVVRRPDLRPPRGRSTKVRLRRPARQGRHFSSRNWPKCRTAHGHLQRPRCVKGGAQDEADARGLKVFDATCPLVTKVHVEVGKMRRVSRGSGDDRPRAPGG